MSGGATMDAMGLPARRAVLVVLGMAVAVPPTLFGLNLVSYAVGSPDSPRYYVGLLAVVALCLAAVPLHAAGRALHRSGWRPLLAVPVVGALGLLALVAVSVPREYDEGRPMPVLLLAVVGVVTGGTALSARAPGGAVRLGLGALASFYLVCLLLDAASFLPLPSGGSPPVPSEQVDPVPVPPLPSPSR